jgi:hypothetical protein
MLKKLIWLALLQCTSLSFANSSGAVSCPGRGFISGCAPDGTLGGILGQPGIHLTPLCYSKFADQLRNVTKEKTVVQRHFR